MRLSVSLCGASKLFQGVLCRFKLIGHFQSYDRSVCYVIFYWVVFIVELYRMISKGHCL